MRPTSPFATLAIAVAASAGAVEIGFAVWITAVCLPAATESGFGAAIAAFLVIAVAPLLAMLGGLHLLAVLAARRGFAGGYLGLGLCLIASTALAFATLPPSLLVWAASSLLLSAFLAFHAWLARRGGTEVEGPGVAAAVED